jgi:hypothetical protein
VSPDGLVIAALILAVVVSFMCLGLALNAYRHGDQQRDANAELVAANQRRAREDYSRICVLRDALDAANKRNGHFVEWTSEPPIADDRRSPGGES